MAIIIVRKSKGNIVDFRRKTKWIFGRDRSHGNTERCVIVVGNVSVNIHEVGDVFVAVVEVVGNFAGCWEKDERTGGDGLRGVPNVGVEEGVVCATELLDAEVVVVDEALESVGIGRLGAHFDAAAHAVKNHRDHGVALRPTDGPVFGVVND